MITAVVLGCYAAAVGIGAPRLLPNLWPADRIPRLTVALLLVLSCSLPVAAIIAGVALGVTLLDTLASIDPGIDACADQLPINDESAIGPLLGTIGLVVAGLLTARIGYCMLATFLTARSKRRAHAEVLRICGRRDDDLDATILDHHEAASYCLPGRRHNIVVTTKAVELLSPEQLGAVLAHERAHQRGRHHLLLALVAALRRAVPGVRLLTYAESETRRLVELIADDAAARRHSSRAVAGALAVIGTGHPPGGALGIGGEPPHSPAFTRIKRLTTPAGRRGRGRATLSGLIVAAAVAVPLALTAGSLAVVLRHCPPSTDDEHPRSGAPFLGHPATATVAKAVPSPSDR